MGILEDIEGRDDVPAQQSVVPDEAPKGVLGQIEARSAAEAPQKVTGETPWSEVLTTGAKNISGDVVNTAGDVIAGLGSLGHAVMHPQETYKGLQNADWGKIGEQLKHDYLTEEGWKQGIAERPVSRLLDVSTVLAGPEALAARSGVSGLQKAAKVARAVDPANLAVKGIGKSAEALEKGFLNVVGAGGTHTGGLSLNLLRQGAKEGPEGLAAGWKGLRSKGDATDAVRGFEEALKAHRTEVADAYRTGKIDWGNDRQILSYQPIAQAITEVESRFGPGTRIHRSKMSAVEKATFDVRQQLQDAFYSHMIKDFKSGNPVFRNPLGFDDLKHDVDAILDATTPGTEAHAAATIVRQAIAKELTDNAPVYARSMEDYAKGAEATKAFRRELSLGRDPDTALRKLYSSLRHNVTANYSRRWELVKKLAEHPAAKRALYELAGQTNAAWTPRGLVGSFKTGSAPFVGPLAYMQGYLQPWMLPLLATQSPQAMGMLALGSGWLSRQAAKVPWRPFIYAGHAMGSPYAYSTMTPNSEVE